MNLSTNLIKIQYPHPELDPRLKYNTIYFQPAHPFYSKSVLQLLSYALSSSLNNYYALLKDQKIIVAKLPEASKEKNEYICIQNKCDQFKKTIFLKQNKFSTVQQKNQTINFGQGSVKVQKVQKCIISSNSTLHQSCIPEIRDNISNNKILKTTQQSKQSLGPDQKQKIEHNSDQRLIGEAKLPKLGIRTQEKQLLREDLLMRQIMSFPVKQKPNGTFREIRSLHK